VLAQEHARKVTSSQARECVCGCVSVSVCQCVMCVCVCHVCVHVHAREHGDKGTRRCEEASLCESSCLKNCH